MVTMKTNGFSKQLNGDIHAATKRTTEREEIGHCPVSNGVNGRHVGVGANEGAQVDERVSTVQTSLPFLRKLVDVIIQDGLVDAMDRNTKVCEFLPPAELKARFPEFPIGQEPASDAQLVDVCKKIIKYSVKTVNPRFFNQLFGGMDVHALGGAWLTEALNSSQYTYEVAPVFTLLEKEIFNKMLGLIGFQGGDAIFVPGGSMGNVYGMNVARYRKFPEVKEKGLYSLKKPIALFTSDKGHYSITKGAAMLGLGTGNIFKVGTDSMGRMLPKNLEKQVEAARSQGYEPYFVNATAGTTVLGAYDRLDAIADVCERLGLWLHVDGAWGGSVAVSRKYRHLIQGIERADSMTWNPHKMMGAPLQCSVFLTKHKGVLQECHSAHARYLFQQDKNYDVSYDTGDMSLQCGRKIDVLKLWLLWRSKGDTGMERDIDHLFSLSRHLASEIRKTAGFRLIAEPECTNVCFWYIPPSMRGQTEDSAWFDRLAKVAPAIKAAMMREGSLMIGYNPDGDLVNFFRMVVSNFDSTTADMDFVLSEIDRLGRAL
ncbi:cysteine sulfinic acid decarboxylase-like isoform X2 [Mya arenaria]|uniref:cysteine sulfinic acid decarboxylase-like isoform X2 n=1 Tax=Mya arenaria TaxID=6604 RepID=UPI0022DEA6BB|nr:cysteine sulfinic acid decarboxylase-like isoform X2 [Mya arenaria]